MANDYFNEQFGGQSHGLARVATIVASLRAIATGFGKLPTEEQLKTDSTTSAVATGGPVNYVVTLAFPPAAFVDQMRIGVRFPVANTGPANLDIIGADGTNLGSKPIRQIDGTPLGPGHIGVNAEGILQYSAVGQGHWTLVAGARGIPGPPGPPEGTFSVNTAKELVFSNTSGTPVANLGQIAPLFIGAYDALTEYTFLEVVSQAGVLYIHFGTAATTGTAVTDDTVWQAVVTLVDASTTVKGVVELTTSAELRTGTDTTRAATAKAIADKFQTVTQAEYDALTPLAGVFYFIPE